MVAISGHNHAEFHTQDFSLHICRCWTRRSPGKEAAIRHYRLRLVWGRRRPRGLEGRRRGGRRLVRRRLEDARGHFRHLREGARLQAKALQTLQGSAGDGRSRCRHHRHPAALARAAVHRRLRTQVGGLLREAAGVRHPRRPGDGERVEKGRQSRAGWIPAPPERRLQGCERLHRVGQTGQACAGRREYSLQRQPARPEAESIRRRRSIGISGADPRRRFPTRWRSAIVRGGSNRPPATGTSSTGAST